MEKFYNLIKDKYSFPIAATLVEDRYLYFVTYYNNILYKLDLETDEYEEILMPVGNKKEEAFWHIVCFNGKLLFVPYREKFFLEYDIAESEFNIRLEDMMLEKPAFRDCKVADNYLLLADTLHQKIWVIDLNTMLVVNKISLDTYAKLPGSSLFWLEVCGRYVYVFGRIGKAVLKVNYLDGKANLINTIHERYYGAHIDNMIYYMPNPEYEPQICGFDLKNGKVKKLCDVDVPRVKGVGVARYWRPKKLGDEIFFLPFEAAEMIVYHLKENKVEIVNTCTEESKSYHFLYGKAIADIVPYKNGYVVTSFTGNTILKLDSNKDIVKTYTFRLSDKFIEEYVLEQEDNSEIQEGVVSLEDFIEYVKNNG